MNFEAQQQLSEKNITLKDVVITDLENHVTAVTPIFTIDENEVEGESIEGDRTLTTRIKRCMERYDFFDVENCESGDNPQIVYLTPIEKINKFLRVKGY